MNLFFQQLSRVGLQIRRSRHSFTSKLPNAIFKTCRSLSTVKLSIIEALKMELIAIIVLGISTLVGFSTKERKPEPKTDNRNNDDPDWAFTQSCDVDSNSREG